MLQGRDGGRILKEGRKGRMQKGEGKRGRGGKGKESMNSNLQLSQKIRGWLVDLEADEPTSDVQPRYAGTS